jgi:TPR repeat protein
MTNLGVVFEKAGDFDEAENWYSKASSLGCCRALNLLGMLQYHGRGSYARKRLGNDSVGEKKLAFLSFCASAKGGHANAFFNCGNCLEYGIGTEADAAKAMASYREGAALGCPQAMYSLGYLLVKEELKQLSRIDPSSAEYATQCSFVNRNAALEEGIKCLRMAFENGVVDAAYQLGRVYESGPTSDYKSALLPYLWAAEKGHSKAAFCAANILYMYGDDTSREGSGGEALLYRRRALDLYKQASQAGIPDAMNSLGLMLEGDENYGSSKADDLENAAREYYGAACLGHQEATLNLALLLASGKISTFVLPSGQEMTLRLSLEWLEQKGQVSKDHLISKFEFALRRIDALIQEVTAERNARSTVGASHRYGVSPQRSQQKPRRREDTSERSMVDDSDSVSAKPPRHPFSSMVLSMAPTRLDQKLASAPAGLAAKTLGSSTSRSVLNLEMRESLPSSPYSGLKPLNKQYEALSTATTYVSLSMHILIQCLSNILFFQ